MEGPTRTGETLKEVLLSSFRSTAFWSTVAVAVGVLAIIVGGVLFLTVDEFHDFSISALIIGVVLLFVSLVLSPRAVGEFLIGTKGRFGANIMVMTAAFIAIVVLVNFLLFRDTARFDFTYTRIFSLSPQTEQVLDGLDTPIRANFFVVPSAANDIFVTQPAEDLLSEFERRAGKFTYRIVDPELNRTLALQYDVTRYPAIVFEDVDTGVRQHVVCASLTGIPGCLNFREQEFVTGILVATAQEQKSVYLLTGHGERSASGGGSSGDVDDEGFDFAIEGLRRDNYNVLPLNLRQIQGIPADAAALIIAGPDQDLTDSEVLLLEDYIRSGGRVAALLDPGTPRSFVDLLARWGIALGGHSLADAISNVAGQRFTPLLQNSNGQFSSSPEIPITEQLDTTFFPGVTSVLTTLSPADIPPFIGFYPLGVTTPASWLESNPERAVYDEDQDFLGSFPVVAAFEISGTVDETERHALAKFVIFGDSDFTKNFFYASDDNNDLFLNSVNWLADDFELISIRPKLNQPRRLVLTSREADLIKWSGWLLPPSFMLLLGGVVWWRRR